MKRYGRNLAWMVALVALQGMLGTARAASHKPVLHGQHWVALTGKPLRVAHAKESALFNPKIDAMTGFEKKSILCVPLKTTRGTIGVLELLNKRGGHPYRDRDEEIICYLAEQAAISILETQFPKRQIGIGPGQGGQGFAGRAFWVVDQLDSLAGMLLFVAPVWWPSPGLLATIVVIMLIAHPVSAWITVLFGLKDRVG